PKVPNDIELYIVDFCYPIEDLVSLAERVSKVVVLDHHISAQKDLEAYLKHSALPDNLQIEFIQTQSGCIIAWHYFHADAEAPVLLQHIEDHDLWRHKLAKTEAICKALYLRLPIHFSAFEKIKLHTLRQEGAVLLKQQQFNVRRLLKTRHAVRLNDLEGLAVNAPAVFSSDLGHELAEISGTFGLTYHYHGKHRCYECALRSVGEFDVSVLAKKFGGGGHKNAAGFRVDQATFLSFLCGA
ncbi:MAG: DHH family phosphoesterase, partial [Methyloprofundus sp.]|nr:DHH family phosphoesterase [Methyloprofundus sp.]